MATGFTELNPGSLGSKVAGDFVIEDGVTKEFQRLKVVWGAIGTINETTTSTPFPVQVSSALPAGTNNIGDVDVLTLPALPAGTNNIGDVDVLTVPAPLNLTGGGVEASALRVTIASDSTGVLSVDDNGGSLTVDGSVTATQGTAANLKAQVQGEAAADVAVSGNPLLSGARASTATPTAVGADGRVVTLWADRRGALKNVIVDDTGDSCMDGTNDALRVNVVAGSSGGVSATDDGAFTVGSGSVVPVAGTYRSTRDSVDDNDVGALAMNQKRGLYVSLETPNSDSLVDDTSDAVKVVGPIAHDAANAGNHNPLLMGARAANSVLAAVSADGDATVARSDRFGQLFVRLADAAGDSMADEANDSLRVSIVNGGGTGGTAMTDDGAFTVGSTQVTPVAGTYRSTRDTVDDNDAGALAMTQRRALLTCIETPLGDSAMDDTNDAVRVNCVTGTVLVSPNEAQSNANITAAAQTVSSQTGGYGGSTFEITGTWVGTIEFEGRSISGFTSILAYPVGSTGAPVTSTTANGTWHIDSAGFDQIRMRSSAWTSGTATCLIVRTTADVSRPFVGAGVRDAVGNAITSTGGALNVNFSSQSFNFTVDVASVISGTSGTSLGKAEDAAASNGDTGVAVLFVRRDTASSGVGADGDYASPCVDSSGRIHVNVGTMPALVVEDASSAGGENSLLIAGVRNDAAASKTSADGDFGNIAIDSAGRVGIADLGGSISIDDGNNPLLCRGSTAHDAPVSQNPFYIGGVASAAAPADVSADNDVVRAWFLRNGSQVINIAAGGALITGDATNGIDVDVTRVSGTVTTQDNSSLVDNAAFTDGTSRVLPIGMVFDETAGTALTENDVAAARIDSKRAQVLVLEDATTRGQRVAVNAGGALEVQGDIAHDSAVGGNPVLIGLEARTTDGTAVTSGDAVRGLADTLGKQVVLVGAVHDLQVRGTANYTNTTASDLVAAAGAGVRIAVMGCLVTNGHATVSTKVELRDGTTVKIQGYAVAAGGGFALSGGGVPLFISTANTAVTGRNVTTGSDVDITVWGYKIGN